MEQFPTYRASFALDITLAIVCIAVEFNLKAEA